MTVTGGRAVVEALDAWGVEVVFGIPGVHTLSIYDALYEHPRIRHITVRHEQGGAVSVVQAVRFAGTAASPVVVTPVYHADPLAGFLVPAALLAAGVPTVLTGVRTRRRPDGSGPPEPS